MVLKPYHMVLFLIQPVHQFIWCYLGLKSFIIYVRWIRKDSNLLKSKLLHLADPLADSDDDLEDEDKADHVSEVDLRECTCQHDSYTLCEFEKVKLRPFLNIMKTGSCIFL